MNPFVQGFIARGKRHGFKEAALLPIIKKAIELATDDSVFSAAGTGSTGQEVFNILKHIGSHSLIPGAAGAAIGAASSKNKTRGALTGGLIGGALGGGLDAYQLGANARTEFSNDMQDSINDVASMKGQHPFYDKAMSNALHNKDVADKSYWFDYYYPPRILENLK